MCVCVVYDSVKVKVVYTKKSLYPPEGGEYCLEELRELQYPCNDDDDNGMEMTQVIHQLTHEDQFIVEDTDDVSICNLFTLQHLY